MICGVVAIVGAPNVGKSTIFNRFLGERFSIVDDIPGLTRDRIYGRAEWLTKSFRLIDTGGIEIANRPYQEQIRVQAKIAIEEADVILFIVDGQLGLTSDDRQVAQILYKSGKPIILAVNKIDDGKFQTDINDFYALGLGDPIAISGAHGIGIGDVLDKIVNQLPDKQIEEYEGYVRFSVIGRPNVGKSSLVNAILDQERVIVSPLEGTTRDAIDTPFRNEGRDYVVIDTAGLKKRGQIYESVDKYAALRALKAIDRSDVVLLVIDAEVGIQEQDKHVAGYAFEAKKAMVIVVNKWDLVKKDTFTMAKFEIEIRENFKFLEYASIIFLSAKQKTRIKPLFEKINLAFDGYSTHIGTSVLNDVLQDAQIMNPTPHFKGGRIKIYYGNQVDIKPPTIVLFVNDPAFMHFSYMRYLENRLRDSFHFDGTPLNLVLRERK